MIETVNRLLFRHHDADVVYECRECGTSVDSVDAECPSCGRTDVATFVTE